MTISWLLTICARIKRQSYPKVSIALQCRGVEVRQK